MTLSIIYWVSFVLLLFTKALDVWSTIRFVPPTAETNPWARKLFCRYGFKSGVAIVAMAFLIIAGSQYLLVWWLCTHLVQWLNAGLGTMIAWVQWDVARFNRSGMHSRMTRLALQCYGRWARRMKDGVTNTRIP